MYLRPFSSVSALAVTLALVAPSQARADDDKVPAQAATETQANGTQVFDPAYFAAYAPRNALDMVQRIPGFQITGGNDQGQRGLGQATQNVIVNGERLSSKSDSVYDQLRRIPAGDVIRIELVDGNSTSIPGLTGQVANIISKASKGSGQFRWETGFRAHNTEAQLYGGEVSISGKSGKLTYTAALSNDNDRFGADGPVVRTAGNGDLIENKYTKFAGKFDNPKLATTFAYDFGGGVQANLNMSAGTHWFDRIDPEIGYPAIGPIRTRASTYSEDGPSYEIGGDFQFPLGPGSLKLIGLERFSRDHGTATLVDAFADDSPSLGYLFKQTNAAGERIGRFEYSWKLWKADWQLSGEAAFNRLDRTSSLAILDPDGAFTPLPYPEGNGGVTEDRYETSLSFSKALSPELTIQAIGAVEFSTIKQTGSAANSRSFKRPKGSLAATWKPSDKFDLSLTFARRVSQLSFGDFLASVSLNDNNANGGNNELVPYQSWNIELEANKSLGPWGSIKLQAKQAWFQDFIDWFPLPGGGEARGNIGDAHRLHLEANATIKFDPIGLKGAQLNIVAVKRFMHVTDPFTGLDRGFSYDQEGALELDFRHDIPHSQWAWGAGLSHFDSAPYARRYEVGHEWEGKFFDSLFVENKDVLGMTVNASVTNLLGARHYSRRTVYNVSRPTDDVLFEEYGSLRIGPIFRLTISGSF